MPIGWDWMWLSLDHEQEICRGQYVARNHAAHVSGDSCFPFVAWHSGSIVTREAGSPCGDPSGLRTYAPAAVIAVVLVVADIWERVVSSVTEVKDGPI